MNYLDTLNPEQRAAVEQTEEMCIRDRRENA